MWSPLVFCLFVGLVYSSSAPAWKDNTEYVYNIAGRTLASLDIGNEYSGILVKTQLTIQTRPDGKLQALLTKTQYAQIHSELSDGPLTHIPSAQVSWKPLEMSNKPFQIELKRGVITDIIVNKGTPNWEANIYKGIMSQFQIQILNPEQAYHEDRQDSALFKITEETVSGNTQTVYEVSPMPEHALINSEMVPAFVEMEEDDDKILEVVKHKNYTENSELPSYVFGLGNVEGRKAATNMMGEFFVRSTMTRALVTGSSKKFTIQNSVTINEISVSPTLSDRQQGSIMSMWNATLKKVKSQDQIMEDLVSPIHLGGLVYSYNTPFSHSNEVSEKPKDQSGTDYKQDQPQINEAAEAPLLPFTIGNKGRSVKYGSEDIVKSVINLAREIGKDSQDPKKYLGSNTPSKFVILIKLVRIMNEEEIRKVSNELVPNNPHADNQDAIEYATWAVYRDAVGESGSPSALRVIESWIESKIIRKTEAAHVVAAMANSARYPTKEYLRLFFELIQKEVVKQQWPLNETATLSFAGFARQVYFDKSYYNTQFPRKSFNDLGEKAGERFVKDTVIPYFEESLNKAISQDKPNRIHMYIRALGHIGAPEILKAFEPYLEGKKQCSQFQRALMVISMDKLVKTFPDVARPVLFRLYSNNGEEQTVRVAAVYQLMRANPTPEMIQRMAAYTKVDVHEQVNAAVKTSIQHFANLDAEEFADMSHMTKMAEPLLTETDYGIHQGGNYLKNYFAEELQYKETIQLIGSSDYFAPKGIKYALRASEGGVKDQIVNAQALLTSIEQLTDVLSQQTQSYDDERKQQKQNAAEQQQHPFSSQNVARLLNMQLEAEEQLEGSAFVMDWNMAYKMFSFDNDTIRQLPSALEHWEKKLNGDNEIDYVKWTNTDDITIAFPTEMGIPFVFTYDNPMFYRVEGRVRMAADPKWAQNGKIQKPKTIKWNSDMRVTVGKKIQGHISFVTPFDHQQYYSGFDKLMQVHVPVVATAELDLKNNELTIEAEPENKKSNAPLFHYSTWPYTSRRDIMDFRSLVAQKHSQYIMPSQMRTMDVTVGKEQTGLAYQIKMEHDRATVKMSDMQVFYEKGIVDGLRNLWNDADIQYSQLNVTHVPRQSSTKKIQIRLGYDQDYSEEGEKASVSWNQISKANEPSERRELLLKKASADISNVKAHAVDISLRFKGDKNMDYVLSAACASSNVDPQSRAFAYLKQDTPRGKPYEIKLSSSMEVENSNALNMEDAFAADPKARAEIELEVESDDRDNAKVKAEIKASRSEKRKEYLKSRPLYYQCKHDMREGNNQSPACVNMTIRAPVMDKMEMDIKFDNVNPAVEDTIEMLYEHLKYEFYPRLSIDRKQRTESENKIKVQTFADPDFWYLNVTVKTSEQETSFKDIGLDRYTKPLLALHPSIPVYDRVLSRVFEINTINPTCVVDQSQITTFNNWTYDASVSDKWTVLAQFLPKRANQREQIFSAEKQLNAQRKNFVILVRESKESKKGKEVKVVLSTPRTDFKIIEINMTPKQSSKTKGSVTVNNQKIEVRDSESQDFADGFIQIFALPNGEIKMVVEDKFDLMYDGQRLRLEATTSMWRDSTRGLCGQANDQPNEDPLTPQNCYARDVDKFIKSFEIQGEEGQQVRQEFEEDSDECVERNMPLYVNAITKGETEVFDNSDESQSNECNRHQTRYVEQENEICFTTRVVPVCSRHCQAQGYITKTVSVHCIAKNNVALIWKKQIDNGSNPDFSHKKEHKKVQLEIPQSCSF